MKRKIEPLEHYLTTFLVKSLKYRMKSRYFMAKYYSYEGKQVGWVRKKLDEVVVIEEAWVNEIRQDLAQNGYDKLLLPIASVLDAQGHPPITRAQAWTILHDLTNDGVPTVLQNTDADEAIGLGKLVSSAKKTAASAADAVTTPVGKVVGGTTKAVSKGVKKVTGGSSDSKDE